MKKRTGLILATLGLFALSVFLAFQQGSLQYGDTVAVAEGSLSTVQASPLIYTGFRAEAAKLFAAIFNPILAITGNSVLLGIIVLGLLVELMLLYPSVRIQIKQKKIHLFHKKLVDRFNRGELSVSKTEDELHKLYDVNERIHRRGALMVVIQLTLFIFTFWGLSLMVKAPSMIAGSWNVLNFSLLSHTQSAALPVLAGLIYFVHAMIRISYKDREDYISAAQTTLAAVFAVVGAAGVYLFASIFSVALTVYFMTLVTFATVRYIVVEQHAKEWGKFAQRELIKMLREAGPHRNRFEYFSRLWNHLPIIRHLNFNLLEEALSMTLGLLIALTFFGAFQDTEASQRFETIFGIAPLAVTETINPIS